MIENLDNDIMALKDELRKKQKVLDNQIQK